MSKMIAEELMKKEDLKKVSPEDKITSAVSQLKSTHDAVFVCDDGRYKGIVNLYHSFLGKKWDHEEKVKTCLYQPPTLTKDTPIEEIARLMVESRVYRLPVLEKKKFLGAVYAEDVLAKAKRLDLFSQPISQVLDPRQPVFVSPKATITEAIHKMLGGNTNRLLVGTNEKLEGILTLYDLRMIYSQPRDRISGVLSRTPIKEEFGDKAVEGFYQSAVITVDFEDSLTKAIDLMVDKNIGSLVVTQAKNGRQPVGLITWRDFLGVIANFEEEGIDVSFSQLFTRKSLKLAKQSTIDKLQWLVDHNPLFTKKVKRVDLKLEEVAKSKDNMRLPLLEVTAMVRLKKGNKLLRSEVKGRTVKYMVDEVFDNIKRLLRKDS